MLQGGFLAITVVVTFCNLVADLLYYELDPRIST
jgi:ABC-type dipeptide/oligopeptide/nickel transport system permease component